MRLPKATTFNGPVSVGGKSMSSDICKCNAYITSTPLTLAPWQTPCPSQGPTSFAMSGEIFGHTCANKTKYIVHKLNFGSQCQPIQITNKVWSEQNKSPSNQLHKCETKNWKGNRVFKIGNIKVLRVTILAFVHHHSSNIDIFVCIVLLRTLWDLLCIM